jgi:hypothetical protein
MTTSPTLTYDMLRDELAHWTFLPGWRFGLRVLEPATFGGYLRIIDDEPAAALVIHSRVPDTHNPDEPIDIQACYPMPPLEHWQHGGLERFRLWLRDMVHDRMRHEADEWLKRDGVMVYDPHATVTR